MTFRHNTRLLVLLCFLGCYTLDEDVTFDYILSVTRHQLLFVLYTGLQLLICNDLCQTEIDRNHHKLILL